MTKYQRFRRFIMGNVIQTNVAALGAQKSLFRTNTELATTFSRLSSGFRINSAKDDASGLVISNILTAEASGSKVALRNANDGISLAQVADGALNEVGNILLRMRDLTISAVSGQNAGGLAAIELEFAALNAEITRIGADTNFAGTNVFAAVNVTVNSSGTSVISIGAAFTAAPGGTAAAGTAAIDTAIGLNDTARAGLGAASSRLTFAANSLGNQIENSSAAASRIRDTDFAVETANLAKFQVLQQAGFSVLAQANANSQSILSLLQ